MFQSESDLRKWMRDGLLDKVRFVEPSRGSTIGLPDCWAPLKVKEKTTQVWVELKLATVVGDRMMFTIRPEQRKQIASMVRDEVVVGLIVAEKGGDRVWALGINDSVLAGDVSLKIAYEGDWGLELAPLAPIGPQQGLYFIFFVAVRDDDG